jgi:ketosteroid isomerase-like protein
MEAFMRRLSLLRKWKSWKNSRTAGIVAMLLILLASTTLMAAQKNKKNAKDVSEPEVTGASSTLPLSDAQTIELMVSQMLGAWQIGDEQMLHTFYADDVLVVSGAWEPPLQGWPNYLRAYLSQRARTQGVRLDRTDTFAKVLGTTAWCTYQWEFTGQVDGAAASAVGQTTLVFEKRAGKWLIVVNHTSVAPLPQGSVPASAVPAPGTSPQTAQPVRPLAGGAPGR